MFVLWALQTLKVHGGCTLWLDVCEQAGWVRQPRHCVLGQPALSKRNITTDQQQDEVLRECKLGYFGVLLPLEDVGLDLHSVYEMGGSSLPPLHCFSVESVVAEMLVHGVHTTHRLVVFVDNFGLVDVHFLPCCRSLPFSYGYWLGCVDYIEEHAVFPVVEPHGSQWPILLYRKLPFRKFQRLALWRLWVSFGVAQQSSASCGVLL